eukprot:4306697-Prymnesium_polylepis.2
MPRLSAATTAAGSPIAPYREPSVTRTRVRLYGSPARWLRFHQRKGPRDRRPQTPGLVITHCLPAQNTGAARGQLRRLGVPAASEIAG